MYRFTYLKKKYQRVKKKSHFYVIDFRSFSFVLVFLLTKFSHFFLFFFALKKVLVKMCSNSLNGNEKRIFFFFGKDEYRMEFDHLIKVQVNSSFKFHRDLFKSTVHYIDEKFLKINFFFHTKTLTIDEEDINS